MAQGYTTERFIPAVEGEQYEPVLWKPLPDPARYAIYVDPASFSVMSKMMLRRLGLALFKMRTIDRASLLSILDWPAWPEVSSRMDKADAAAFQAKLQMKMAGPSLMKDKI